MSERINLSFSGPFESPVARPLTDPVSGPYAPLLVSPMEVLEYGMDVALGGGAMTEFPGFVGDEERVGELFAHGFLFGADERRSRLGLPADEIEPEAEVEL